MSDLELYAMAFGFGLCMVVLAVTVVSALALAWSLLTDLRAERAEERGLAAAGCLPNPAGRGGRNNDDGRPLPEGTGRGRQAMRRGPSCRTTAS